MILLLRCRRLSGPLIAGPPFAPKPKGAGFAAAAAAAGGADIFLSCINQSTKDLTG
jgi:hypothetical protein